MTYEHRPCPFCGLPDGFHDEDVHAQHEVPRHLTWPSNNEMRRQERATRPVRRTKTEVKT